MSCSASAVYIYDREKWGRDMGTRRCGRLWGTAQAVPAPSQAQAGAATALPLLTLLPPPSARLTQQEDHHELEQDGPHHDLVEHTHPELQGAGGGSWGWTEVPSAAALGMHPLLSSTLALVTKIPHTSLATALGCKTLPTPGGGGPQRSSRPGWRQRAQLARRTPHSNLQCFYHREDCIWDCALCSAHFTHPPPRLVRLAVHVQHLVLPAQERRGGGL